jgi:hypothetical protein
MSNRSRLSFLLSLAGVLEGLPRVLGSGQVVLLSVLLSDAMGMFRDVVQFGGSMIFVRSVLMTKVHICDSLCEMQSSGFCGVPDETAMHIAFGPSLAVTH